MSTVPSKAQHDYLYDNGHNTEATAEGRLKVSARAYHKSTITPTEA